ncbi:diagnostic antigen gp50 [Echinococcus multilocularis]|uniref:Diagnostic antigen gp50 n=1 Tax=Echinococcus multilocularis TaxID=6211 RepID=A0A068Y176_ECHMU|nr:diagnostic antigen gp50 [Echinococcus multilocularis]
MLDGTLRQTSIIGDSCYADGEVVGRPCQVAEAKNIQVKIVTDLQNIAFVQSELKQAGLQVWVDGIPFSTTVFGPTCTVWRSPMGEIDLQTSAPLSQFPKGQSQIELSFSVQVANSRTWTAFYVNGGFACSWLGGFLVFNESHFCRNLLKDVQSGLSIFAVTITQRNTSVYCTFGLRSENERLVVTVDWAQSGSKKLLEQQHFTVVNRQQWRIAAAYAATTSSTGPKLAHTMKSKLPILTINLLRT